MVNSSVLGIHDWPLFVGAGLLLNLTPGADVAVIVARSAGSGLRAGAAAALGVGAGCGVHVLAATLGLAALLAGSPLVFGLLRWAGAAYLVWLGVGLWRASLHDGVDIRTEPATATRAACDKTPPYRVADWSLVRNAFVQGFLTNALNPKVALFFLAFVPQFVDADATHPAAAFALLGLIFAVNGTLVNLGFAWLAASVGHRFSPGGRMGRWLSRAAAVLFVALGLNLALASSTLAAVDSCPAAHPNRPCRNQPEPASWAAGGMRAR